MLKPGRVSSLSKCHVQGNSKSVRVEERVVPRGSEGSETLRYELSR